MPNERQQNRAVFIPGIVGAHDDEELGRSQLTEQLGGVSVRRAGCEHAELLVNLDIEATEALMQMQIIRN